MSLFWLSFSGPDGPRGVCLVEEKDFLSAIDKSHQLGVNPGGEVLGEELPDDADERKLGTNRLILPAELDRHGYDLRSIHEIAEEADLTCERGCRAN